MHKAPFAEWLLTQASTPERASEVVGDLLEQKTSTAQFWLTIVRIWVALTWRWILGAILAGLSGLIVLAPYWLLVKPRWNLAQPRPEPWMLWAMYIAAAALCLGTHTGLAVSRYGVRDGLTRMSAMIWATLTVCACCAWMPRAALITTLLLAIALVTLLVSKTTRRIALCVLASTAAYAATSALFILLSRPTSIPHASAGATTNVLFGVVTFLASIVIEAMVLARLRPVLLGSIVIAR
jgi:hypothetical protein